MFPVAAGFHVFEGRADFGFHFIQKGSAESVAKESVVEVIDVPPKSIVAVSALRNETVDMGIPFQIPAESVKRHDKAGSEIHGFVLLEEHFGNNAGNSVKKAVKQRTVFQEETSQIFIHGENAVAVEGIYQFKRHTGGTFHGIFIAAGRAEAAMTAKRNKFKLAAVGTAIHGAAKGRVAAADHFFDIFHLSVSGMKSIFNFLKIVSKDFL